VVILVSVPLGLPSGPADSVIGEGDRINGGGSDIVTGPENVLVLGASARAAAFSALRAGLRPWCVDLFADADLVGRCPAMRLRGDYPNAFLDMIDLGPPGPWLYTGGLENHPHLIGQLAARRALWGNGRSALALARAPENIAPAARAADLPAPTVIRGARRLPHLGRWLKKPLHGAGGKGITFCLVYPDLEEPLVLSSRGAGVADTVLCSGEEWVGPECYLQQYIEGSPAAALYVALDGETRLLGLTRQLIGEPWLGAVPFHYCGSIAPLEVDDGLRRRLERLGEELTARARLRGLFGVDGILARDFFWPVEVNPRYTASVEVLEHALGLRALSWHRQAFVADAAPPAAPDRSAVVGKAILFARADLVFPADGPWRDVLRSPPPPDDMPDFADLPHPGDAIDVGRPVLTLFVRAGDVDASLAALMARTKEVERWLYGGAAIG
jgi:predicted ATP-grasp superfamily ATP-dependent carboligase